MVKRLIVSMLFLLGALELGAQNFPFELWYIGEVRLKDDTFLRGNIKYNLERDIIQLERGGRIETFSAQQVTSFTLKVPHGESRRSRERVVSRYFFSLPLANHVGYKRLRFFEVIIEGKATLLAREFVTTINNNAAEQQWLQERRLRRLGRFNPAIPNNSTRRILAHKMYLGTLDGRIREIPRKKKDILHLFSDHQKAMKDYIKAEGLRLDRVGDMARFFTYYNSLGNQQTKAH